MYVKFMQVLREKDFPETSHLFECTHLDFKQAWLKEPDDRFKIHPDPDNVWAPFSARRIYEFPVLSENEPTVSGGDYFIMHGVSLVALYDDNMLIQEVWLEGGGGMAWVMNEKGDTIQKIAPLIYDPDWSPDDDHGPRPTLQEPVDNTGT